jgi:hypothetical protein
MRQRPEGYYHILMAEAKLGRIVHHPARRIHNMHLTTKFLDAVAMAEDRSSNPLLVPWPMPGNLGGFRSFQFRGLPAAQAVPGAGNPAFNWPSSLGPCRHGGISAIGSPCMQFWPSSLGPCPRHGGVSFSSPCMQFWPSSLGPCPRHGISESSPCMQF